MKILHYFLGFPPYRTGGLTKFAYDLMIYQLENGNEVGALWPGKMNFFLNKSTKIQQHAKINGIDNFEIINPLPVPLDEGIKNFNKYTKKCDINVYLKFIDKYKPDVVHIHTLMGIHKEFIEALKIKKVKSIYTTHDYFGICPKVTLYKNGTACIDDNNCKECIKCNYTALSINKIKLMQSPLYRRLKNSYFIKLMRKKHRAQFASNVQKQNFKESKSQIETLGKEYKNLRRYYLEMLENINTIHFNSTLAKQIYEKYINVKNGKVISITHKDIKDNRNIECTNSNYLRFTYLADVKPFKGFNVVKTALDNLYNSGKRDFILNIYGRTIDNPSEYMNICVNKFDYKNLKDIFSVTDVLLAPSICFETFGFTVLEAISYGVPVIISQNVGAKDIIKNGGKIIEPNNVLELEKLIKSITKTEIEVLRNNIRNNVEIKEMKILYEEMNVLYK